MIQIPKLYAILDAELFDGRQHLFLAAEQLVAAGARWLQYRNKTGKSPDMLDQAIELKARIGGGVVWIMNDRADLCLVSGFDGVHVGQNDLSVPGARQVIGESRWLGVSTHNPAQVSAAQNTSADYVAVGPVFATRSKQAPDPVIGLDGVRQARTLTSKPLVAIGGITRANCLSVVEAGADAVAVISDLSREPRKSAEEFFRILR